MDLPLPHCLEAEISRLLQTSSSCRKTMGSMRCRASSSEPPQPQLTPGRSHQTTPEEDLEPAGPRQGRRRPVDYVKLAAALFGGPDGDREPEEDLDYSPGKDRLRGSLGSAGDGLGSPRGPDT